MLRKFSKEAMLNELAMLDNSNIQETTLYKLSLSKALQQFSRVALVSSPQDNYAPQESSRLQVSAKMMEAKSSNKHCDAQIQICDNILSSLRCQLLLRLDIHFSFESSSVDTFIGRAAHISALNCPLVTETLVCRLQSLINN